MIIRGSTERSALIRRSSRTGSAEWWISMVRRRSTASVGTKLSITSWVTGPVISASCRNIFWFADLAA
jgi:hypothetical protein